MCNRSYRNSSNHTRTNSFYLNKISQTNGCATQTFLYLRHNKKQNKKQNKKSEVNNYESNSRDSKDNKIFNKSSSRRYDLKQGFIQLSF